MDIKKTAICGSLESNDILVTVKPGEGDIEIVVDSIVRVQFGDQIEALIRSQLAEMGVQNISVYVQDRGAIDCIIRARLETAVLRAQEGIS
ncbi:MAG: citrate lyase acyl carrier protein [Peptococcaceae bacterium]